MASRSKKKVVALVLIGLIVLSAVALASLAPGGTYGTTSGNKIALVRLSGQIGESATPSLLGGGGISPELVEDHLEQARLDPGVQAVVVRIESPGGAVAASQEIATMIKTFEKPIVISMADTVASGGYYISAPADHIVAQPGTLTGSIGVIWASFDPDKLLKKVGVKIDAITAGKHKDMFLPGKLNPERRKIVQKIVDTMHEQFIEEVARDREMSTEEVRELATGEVFTGTQAQTNGLVDQLGGIDTAVAAAENEAGITDSQVVELSPSLFDSFWGPGATALASLIQPQGLDARIALLRELLAGQNVPRYEL